MASGEPRWRDDVCRSVRPVAHCGREPDRASRAGTVGIAAPRHASVHSVCRAAHGGRGQPPARDAGLTRHHREHTAHCACADTRGCGARRWRAQSLCADGDGAASVAYRGSHRALCRITDSDKRRGCSRPDALRRASGRSCEGSSPHLAGDRSGSAACSTACDGAPSSRTVSGSLTVAGADAPREPRSHRGLVPAAGDRATGARAVSGSHTVAGADAPRKPRSCRGRRPATGDGTTCARVVSGSHLVIGADAPDEPHRCRGTCCSFDCGGAGIHTADGANGSHLCRGAAAFGNSAHIDRGGSVLAAGQRERSSSGHDRRRGGLSPAGKAFHRACSGAQARALRVDRGAVTPPARCRGGARHQPRARGNFATC